MHRLHPCISLTFVLLLGAQATGCHHFGLGKYDPRLPATTQSVQDESLAHHAIEGIIIDADERGVANATVRLASVPPLDATTGTNGQFHFPDVTCSPRAFVITATHGELKSSSTAECGEFLAMRLKPGTARTLSVKDAASEEAICQAEVVNAQEDMAPVMTNTSGTASIKQFDSFFSLFEVKAHGYADQRVSFASDSPVATAPVLLHRGAVASGRVTDKQGKGAGGVTVYIEADATNAPTTPLVSVTDASGMWKLSNLSNGLYYFSVHDKRIGNAALGPIRISGAAAVTDLSLVADGQLADADVALTGAKPERAAPAARTTVHGHVVSAAGAAVAGAQVYVHIGDASETDDVLCDFAEERTTANGEGYFQINGLPEGAKYMWAGAPDTDLLTCPRLQDITAIDKQTGDIRVVVADGGTIKGRVVFAQGGSPAAFDLLQDGMFKSFQRTFTQEPNGAFTIQTFAPGAGDFDLVGPDFLAAQVACNIPSGGTVDVGVISVEPGQTVTGRVVTTEGKPVSDAEVGPATRAIHSSISIFADVRKGQSFTDKDGRYVLSGLEAPDVRAFHPIWGVGTISGAANGNTTIVLQPAGSICGVAKRPNGFTEFKPLSLRAKDNAVLANIYPSAHGLYCFENLPADFYCFQDRSDLSPCRNLGPGAQIQCAIDDGELSDNAICVQVHAGEDVRLDLSFRDDKAHGASASDDGE